MESVENNKSKVKRDKTPSGDTSLGNAFSLIGAEFLFVILPLIVLSIVYISSNRENVIISAPEWSFASTILFGQTIIKLVSGVLYTDENVEWQRPILFITILIVLCLVPTLVILSLMLSVDKPSMFLTWTQRVFFIISMIVFFVLGGVGQHFICEKDTKTSPNK